MTARRRRLTVLGSTRAGDCLVALAQLLAGPRMIRGRAIERYEAAFAARVGVRHGVSFNGARVGLYGVLGALGIGTGDEVLLQVPTHTVVANAIRYRGARPVYVDCDPETWNLDLDAAERLVTPRARALLLQHTFGVPADLDRTVAFVERHGLVLLEDCVHALGATFRGRPLGSFGRAAFFSTEETKIISTTVGGMVVTDDDALADRLRAFQADCEFPPARTVAGYLVKMVAYWLLTQPDVFQHTWRLYERLAEHDPFPRPATADELRGLRPPAYERRLSNAQAHLGLRQLRRLDGNIAHRRRIADVYESRLAGRARVTHADHRMGPSWVRYPVAVPDRAATLATLEPRSVGGTWFGSVLQQAESLEALGYEPGSCTVAEELVEHLVNLPTHPRVRPDDAAAIADLLLRTLEPARADHG